MIRFPNVVCVHPSVPVNSIPELIAYAKANPGKLNMASSGNGSTIQMSGELFKMLTGINMVHIPYRGGAPALTDLIAGQVQVMFDNLPTCAEHVKSGKLRGLAVTSTTRSDVLPDLPTVADFLPGYEASAWYGFAAPKGTPPEIVDRLNKAVNEILADPKVKAKFLGIRRIPDTGLGCRVWQARGRRDRKMGQGGEVCRRQGGLAFRRLVSPGLGRVARRGLAERGRHRRYQRLHEEGIVGRIDVGAQAVRLQFIRDRRSDRGDRCARQALRAIASSHPRARATSTRRRTWPRLVSAIASMRPCAISSIAVMMLVSAACAS